jgi:pimeloyl-ACP methyl ester carboxylesterase
MFGWILLAGAATALACYTVVAALAAHRLTWPARRQPLVEPGEVGLAYEDIAFPARGDALNIAAWHIPAAGARGAVIIAHGVGGCRGREFTISSLKLVEHLVGSGFTVLMLDLRGHGASNAARMTYGIRERRDVLGAVDWLLARGYVPGAIGVLGLSMGGVAGIGAAGEEPAIGALVIDSACADFLAMIRIHFRRFSKLPLFILPGALLFGRLLSGENLARLRPAELLRAIDRLPVLNIHANGDRLVPVQHARALAEAGDGELWITASTKHLGSFGVDPQAYSRRVIKFFHGALVNPLASQDVDSDLFAEPQAMGRPRTTLHDTLLRMGAPGQPTSIPAPLTWSSRP